MLELDVLNARRERLLEQLPNNSVLLLPAAKLATRSNDTEYSFRQNSYFWYLTGFNEPDAWLLLKKESEKSTSAICCLPTDKQAEIWHGRRLGVDNAAEYLSVDEAFSVLDFEATALSWLDGAQSLFFPLGDDTNTDEKILGLVNTLRQAPKQTRSAPSKIEDPRPILDEMRLFKSDAEVALMKRAATITMQAHQRAMAYCEPGKYEYQLEAELHHEFAINGARFPAYASIVGAGENACILHYTENASQIKDGDLVLIDAGAELHGYAADITRTFPANGKFNQPQRQLYQLVLDAQSAALALFKPGKTLAEAGDCAIEVLTQGLMDLGLLTGTLEENLELKTYRQFYMHGLGHWLGLDVHDVGNYKVEVDDELKDRSFEAGMVLTIEPGLYISPDADVEEKWRGIGIRIEDNVLITDSGHEILTENLAKEVEDIEALMQSGGND